MIHLFRDYERRLGLPIRYVWVLLTVVGLGSIYFHATLSLVGQLVDEIAILWVVLAAWAIFIPKSVIGKFPSWFTRNHWYYFMLAITVFLTLVCLIEPEINHIALHATSLPTIVHAAMNRKRTKSKTAYNLSIVSLVWFVLGLTCWIVDRNFCHHLQLFPYLHSFWHVFVCLGGYLSIVAGAFFHAEFEYPETKPVVSFWPENMRFIGVPYVSLTADKTL